MYVSYCIVSWPAATPQAVLKLLLGQLHPAGCCPAGLVWTSWQSAWWPPPQAGTSLHSLLGGSAHAWGSRLPAACALCPCTPNYSCCLLTPLTSPKDRKLIDWWKSCSCIVIHWQKWPFQWPGSGLNDLSRLDCSKLSVTLLLWCDEVRPEVQWRKCSLSVDKVHAGQVSLLTLLT